VKKGCEFNQKKGVNLKFSFLYNILPTFFLLLTIQHAIHSFHSIPPFLPSFLPSRGLTCFSFLTAKEAGLKVMI